MSKKPELQKRILVLLMVGCGAIGGVMGRLGVRSASAADVPAEMAYQAKLTDAEGRAVTGTYDFTLSLFPVATAGAPLCVETFKKVNVLDGDLKVLLGSGAPTGKFARCSTELAGAFANHQEVYVEVSVGDETLAPRALIGSVGHAFHAQNANVAEHAVDGVPPGTIVAFGGGTVPDGWLLCDGAAKKHADLPRLYSALGKAWGDGSTGDGAGAGTDFNVPDLRGRFVRGVDPGVNPPRDPDYASRTVIAPGGALLGVGSLQASQTGPHSHSATATDSGHSHQTINGFPAADVIYAGGAGYNCILTYVGGSACGALGVYNPATGVGAANITVNVASLPTSETRPLNAAVNFIVKS